MTAADDIVIDADITAERELGQRIAAIVPGRKTIASIIRVIRF
ncbi:MULTISPECIES: hypothetical protein [Rhizobium/Agrobacterium group]|uniref:Uncharacterized protein n=1 Tax=Rhizobium soli TaxID=424798 RepID=A0A7X0JQ37_9HYPH|nr:MULTISPECIES: hypothetical protein [Rhizobium/Agrobacterium group]MBB6510776.1 hypothetical protein [Rhizobium soli]